MSNLPKSTLTKYEMAALTTLVPCSGDPVLDQYISASLRLRTASTIMEGIMRGHPHHEPSFVAKRALEFADALIAEFQ